MDIEADPFWPLSATATVLAWVGYVPEFRRLCVERRSSGVGAWMWAVWIVSSALSATYAYLKSAPPLVSLNVAVICGLTVAVAAGNVAASKCAPAREDEEETRGPAVHTFRR